ncbi:MAG: hypothetical protein WDZ45_10860 [Flavobacteriaceae bacterium]
MKQLDVGAQIGGEVYCEVIFFNSDEAFKKLKNSELELTSQVAAVLIEEGKSLNTKFSNGMAEVSVGGQNFEYMPLDKAMSSKK